MKIPLKVFYKGIPVTTMFNIPEPDKADIIIKPEGKGKREQFIRGIDKSDLMVRLVDVESHMEEIEHMYKDFHDVLSKYYKHKPDNL